MAQNPAGLPVVADRMFSEGEDLQIWETSAAEVYLREEAPIYTYILGLAVILLDIVWVVRYAPGAEACILPLKYGLISMGGMKGRTIK